MIYETIMEIVDIFHLCIVLLHHVWMFATCGNILELTTTYTSPENNKVRLNVYTNNTKSKRILVILSGCFTLTNAVYIKKFVNDLKYEHPEIYEKYNIQVITCDMEVSIHTYDAVASYIKELDIELNNIEELVMLGFSCGGVVSSHVLSKLYAYNFTKKIITYDTPLHVRYNGEVFEPYKLYRMDAMMYIMVKYSYENHYDYEKIKYLLSKPNSLFNPNGATEYANIVKLVHNWSDTELDHRSGFNFEQTRDTKVIHIRTLHDPIVRHETSLEHIVKNQDKITYHFETIERNRIGHISNMAFSLDYLKDIVYAINQK